MKIFMILILICSLISANLPSNNFPLTLIVLEKSVNLRKEPLKDGKIIGYGFLGEKFVATEKKGEWYAVKNRNGIPAWVYKDVVAITEDEMLPVPIDSAENIDEKDTVAQIKKKVFTYSKKGRDPFLPLDKSDFKEGLPNINNITLVGILYDSEDAVALFEEMRNNEIVSFSMKIGDPVVSGKLLRIEPDKVVFLLREATFSYTVDKELNVY